LRSAWVWILHLTHPPWGYRFKNKYAHIMGGRTPIFFSTDCQKANYNSFVLCSNVDASTVGLRWIAPVPSILEISNPHQVSPLIGMLDVWTGTCNPESVTFACNQTEISVCYLCRARRVVCVVRYASEEG